MYAVVGLLCVEVGEREREKCPKVKIVPVAEGNARPGRCPAQRDSTVLTGNGVGKSRRGRIMILNRLEG